MNNPSNMVSFARDIRPLFRTLDIEHMAFLCDLSKYEDVRDNAQDILGRLKGLGGRRMPPSDAGGPWSAENIALFQKWVDDGCPA